MKSLHTQIGLAVVILSATICGRSFADPLPGEVLKFEQLPLNNGLAPSVGGAPYPGHDELSTADLTSPGNYSGAFAADDFADNYSTPVVHVSWWGSYLNASNVATGSSVQQFLISFESDVPAGVAPSFSHPGTPLLTEVVNAGALSYGSGTFTETPIASNTTEPVYQYNAELALPFQEQKDTVYWLKIVALVNNPALQWGWHNRDWGIPDPLASPVPVPGENIEGTVANLPVWHFQDDAVDGQVAAAVNAASASIIQEATAGPLNYESVPSGVVDTDGPPIIGSYSEDLSFALYTVPEPSAIVLLGLGMIGLGYVVIKKQIRQTLARASGFFGVLVLFASCLVVSRARAETLYATANDGYSEIDQVDTVTNSVTTYLNTIAPPDSVMFDSSGDVIYSTVTFGNGEVVKYNPITMASTILASGLTNAADMVLEPGGNSMLVSDYGSGIIDRINLITPSTTPLVSSLGNPEGLAYVGNKLFANIGYRYGGATGKEVAQIDPVTGAILATSPGLNSLDGLTYDSYSGLLYASSLFGNLVYSINPNNLSIVQIATGTLGVVPGPDGIASDGIGNIFIASSDSIGDSHVYQLDLINNTLTQGALVNGLDDLAPASGGGSIPEPPSLALLSLGVCAFGFRQIRRLTRAPLFCSYWVVAGRTQG
jgi:hypothetical protein